MNLVIFHDAVVVDNICRPQIGVRLDGRCVTQRDGPIAEWPPEWLPDAARDLVQNSKRRHCRRLLDTLESVFEIIRCLLLVQVLDCFNRTQGRRI
jgi:hypothetical protein